MAPRKSTISRANTSSSVNPIANTGTPSAPQSIADTDDEAVCAVASDDEAETEEQKIGLCTHLPLIPSSSKLLSQHASRKVGGLQYINSSRPRSPSATITATSSTFSSALPLVAATMAFTEYAAIKTRRIVGQRRTSRAMQSDASAKTLLRQHLGMVRPANRMAPSSPHLPVKGRHQSR
jgi:hypothetical protein